jgi:hypothetical protein
VTHKNLFWDDIDKLKLTDFMTEVLFDLADSLYGQKHGLTVTGNYSMRDLVEHERMHRAVFAGSSGSEVRPGCMFSLRHPRRPGRCPLPT